MPVCPHCGRESPEGFRFCGSCGGELAAAPRAEAREERKVVTVLFCDLVGFTSRAEAMDPEDVRSLLSGYHAHLRAELERFGGTVEKFIGDAVVAVFGAPVAREDDPERAVRAALAIRDWARGQDGLELRVAVNTGEALVTLGARAERGEGMVAGDVVNTAARLQAAAPVQAVLVGETAYHATERAIEYRGAEPVVAKGKDRPVPVWEALAPRARVGVERLGGARLVGRESELTLLREALARVQREREPQLVTLVGIPGIGKSRLVFELFKAIEAGSELVAWRRGGSLPYGEGVAFWALGEMIKAQAGILETDPPSAVEDKLAHSVGTVLERSADAAWVERHLRPLVGLEGDASVGGDRRAEAFAAWRRYLEGLAEQRPLVLVFEDLHWADDALLDFVDHLADWARGVPLLVLATARPELLARRAGWGGGKLNSATVLLSPLTEEETSALVHDLLDRPVLPTDVEAELLERAGGNPLYAEEFVRMLRERPGTATLPESVQGIIAARLDVLPRVEKELLQDAAVLGRVFWLGALGNERWTLEERLHALERKELVRRERRSSVAGESEYAFRHALVREVAYEQIPRAQRAEKHRRAAAWIERLGRPDDQAEMLAHHYLSALEYARAAGLDRGDLLEPARSALRAAGDRAIALNAFASAARFYESALDLVRTDDESRQAELLLGLATAFHRGVDERAERALERAAEAALATGDRASAAEARVMLTELWWNRGRRDLADGHLRRARVLVSELPRSAAKARVLSNVSRFLALAGESEHAIAVGSDALALADELSLDEIRAHALDNIGISRFALGDTAGLGDLERSIEIATAASSPEAARAYNNLAALHWQLGDLQRTDELLREAVGIAERIGDSRGARFSRGFLVNLDHSRGRWDEYLQGAAAFLAESEQYGGNYQDVYMLVYGGMVELARGADPTDRVMRGLALARTAGDPQAVVPALAVAAFVDHELGRSDEALRHAREAVSLAKPIGFATATFVYVPLIADRLGIESDGETVFGVRLATRWTEAVDRAFAGDYEGAADALAAMGNPPAEAYARLRAGERLAAEGRRAKADAQLGKAVTLFAGLGATRFVEQAERLLERVA